MKTVAVIGASTDRRKFGNKALRAFLNQGYNAIPINPNEKQVEGHPTYPSVIDVPGGIDLATIYVPPEIGIKVLDDIAAKRIGEVWLNPGADHPSVVARARELGLKTVRHCSIMAIGVSAVVMIELWWIFAIAAFGWALYAYSQKNGEYQRLKEAVRQRIGELVADAKADHARAKTGQEGEAA